MKRLFQGFGFMALLAILCAAIPSHRVEASTTYIRTGGYDIGGSQRIGIGLQSGGVSGLSLKYFMTQGTALQLGLGGSPWGFGANIEFLAHAAMLTRGGPITIPLYFGIGVGIGSWSHGYWGYGDDASNMNVHIPLGLAFEFHGLPIDIFFQIEPGLALVPYFSPSVGSTFGARIFF